MTPSNKKEEKEKEVQGAQPSPEKEKKLNDKLIQKLKFYGVVALLSSLCAGFIWFIFKPDTSKQVEGVAGINTTIPEAAEHETEGDKRKAYEQEQLKNRRQEKVRNLQDVTNDFLMLDEKEPEAEVSKENPIQESQQTQKQISRQITSFYQEPRENPQVSELERQVKELNEKLEQQAGTGKDPLELMEKSYELAARYFPSQGGEVKSIQPTGNTSSVTANTAIISAGRATENVVSSLAMQQGMDTIPRNYGFATAVGAGQTISSNTIRACISDDQTVVTGSRVKLRLLEPLQVGSVLVPANTPLYGVARIEGQRMNLTITTIESGGNILPVELAAHDMDGQAGLFVPNTAERTALKEAAANVGSGLGTSITFARNASQQLTMDLTRGIMNGGSQYLATKMREVKISIKANYQLLLISKK